MISVYLLLDCQYVNAYTLTFIFILIIFFVFVVIGVQVLKKCVRRRSYLIFYNKSFLAIQIFE